MARAAGRGRKVPAATTTRTTASATEASRPFLVRALARWASIPASQAGSPGVVSAIGAADGPGRGQQREGGQAQPDDEPGGLRDGAADGAGGGERGRGGAGGAGADGGIGGGGVAAGGVAVGGPEEDGEEGVKEDGAGGAVDQAGCAGQHAPEALAEPPYGQGPDHRSGQGELDGRAPGDAEAEQQLDNREKGVQRDHVMPDNAGRPGNGAGHDGGITVGAAGQHLRETAAEHGRLELQHAVKQPERAEGQLQRPARVEGDGHTLVSSGRPGNRVADGEALAHPLVPSSSHSEN